MTHAGRGGRRRRAIRLAFLLLAFAAACGGEGGAGKPSADPTRASTLRQCAETLRGLNAALSRIHDEASASAAKPRMTMLFRGRIQPLGQTWKQLGDAPERAEPEPDYAGARAAWTEEYRRFAARAAEASRYPAIAPLLEEILAALRPMLES
jgi:hypothetical protein